MLSELYLRCELSKEGMTCWKTRLSALVYLYKYCLSLLTFQYALLYSVPCSISQ